MSRTCYIVHKTYISIKYGFHYLTLICHFHSASKNVFLCFYWINIGKTLNFCHTLEITKIRPWRDIRGFVSKKSCFWLRGQNTPHRTPVWPDFYCRNWYLQSSYTIICKKIKKFSGLFGLWPPLRYPTLGTPKLFFL